ncbi:MAG: hypothetical protein AVDCRST_MAG96-2675 [uncultured Segetibacter sp.]|uniref:Uncharacterized protein n=1 Tax=uncultured Segetibacter sp. TaxID=481133 RepID=A0A6J4T735_9BACT|nr:MAG: hypothetical protein AVDCRST_MAG96-2675 [uncultured Segetibacter sp.]
MDPSMLQLTQKERSTKFNTTNKCNAAKAIAKNKISVIMSIRNNIPFKITL